MKCRILLFSLLAIFFHKKSFSQCNGLPTDCLGTQSYTVSPLPANGFYAQGTVVTFCYTMQNYNQCNSNWFHTLDLTFGPGWDVSTIIPLAIPTSCDGAGMWGYYNNVTSANSGQTYGPCFSYDSPLGFIGNVLDGNPGNNFGDNCAFYNWTFCFSIMVSNSSYGQSLSVDVNALGDGSAGSWTSNTCPGNQFNLSNAFSQACFLSISNTVINPTCLNNDGSISLSVVGNVGATNYSWMPGGQVTPSITGLSSGTYIVTVSDSISCTSTDTFELEFINPVILTTTVSATNCYGYCDGMASIAPSGGVAPYTYSWLPAGQPLSVNSDLCAGVYYVTVTDSNTCSRIDTFLITSPSQIFLNPSIQDATCFGTPDGWATAPATGGAGIYYYNWQPVGQNMDTAKNLAAGIYTVTATDVNGCFADTTITIASPPQIIVTPAITHVSCYGINDGAISTITTQGVSPYEYFWIGTGNANSYASLLLSGAYPLLVTDANGCEELDTFYVLQPDSLTGLLFITSPGCPSASDGYVEMDVTGGTVPYYYMWNGDLSLTGSSLSHISSGMVEVTVTDAHGCSFTMSKIVQPLPDLVIDAGLDVSIDLGQKTLLTATADRIGDYFYQWLPPYNLSDEEAAATYAYPYYTTTYLVKVTDVFSACTGEDSVTVIILPASYVLVPSAFTPNGDGLNDLLYPVMGDLAELQEFKIFNRWGQAVFSDKTHGWDGKYQGRLEEVGTYVYELKYKINDGLNEIYSKSGSIVLIR